jgi:hypothetical protein
MVNQAHREGYRITQIEKFRQRNTVVAALTSEMQWMFREPFGYISSIQVNEAQVQVE